MDPFEDPECEAEDVFVFEMTCMGRGSNFFFIYFFLLSSAVIAACVHKYFIQVSMQGLELAISHDGIAWQGVHILVWRGRQTFSNMLLTLDVQGQFYRVSCLFVSFQLLLIQAEWFPCFQVAVESKFAFQQRKHIDTYFVAAYKDLGKVKITEFSLQLANVLVTASIGLLLCNVLYWKI